jgi:hypothetical protein
VAFINAKLEDLEAGKRKANGLPGRRNLLPRRRRQRRQRAHPIPAIAIPNSHIADQQKKQQKTTHLPADNEYESDSPPSSNKTIKFQRRGTMLTCEEYSGEQIKQSIFKSQAHHSFISNSLHPGTALNTQYLTCQWHRHSIKGGPILHFLLFFIILLLALKSPNIPLSIVFCVPAALAMPPPLAQHESHNIDDMFIGVDMNE